MSRKTSAFSCRLFLSLLLCVGSASAFASIFSLKINGNPAAYPLVSAFVMPGATLTLETGDAARYSVEAPSGTAGVEQKSATLWSWQAPTKAGVYPITVRREGMAEPIRVQAFVLVPSSKLNRGVLNGYRIGQYPPSGKGVYHPPQGFIEVTRATENTFVAPHFQLKQFLCKQAGIFPRYLVLSDRLLLKLEMLLEKANEHGFKISTFHVMSGYRTPAYNRGLGNVKLSRHQFGDAADIYIEDARSGQMADLNGDGKVDSKDAAVLYAMVLELGRSRPDLFPVGGAGTYESTKAHGPFLHVDARGFPATWGTITDSVVAENLPKTLTASKN